MADYTEAFACYILECRDAYNQLCERIDSGLVPADQDATIRITIPAVAVDAIRGERLVAAAEANGHG